MIIPKASHSFRVSPRRAAEIQNELASSVVTTCVPRVVRYVAGVDCAFTRDKTACLAAAVVWDLDEHTVVEEKTASRRLHFPYVPGLLSFREAPAALAALKRVSHAVDALICDAHGIAHPRRFGLACHLGVLCSVPTVGCAKTRLVGEHRAPGPKRGARAPLIHRTERVGTVLRTRDGVKPVYVSVGHLIDLPAAERLVLEATGGFRLPEPTRRADRRVAEYKKGIVAGAMQSSFAR